MKKYILTLLSIPCFFSSCIEKINHPTLSTYDLKNSIRICFENKMFKQFIRHAESKKFRIITNYKLTDTVQVDGATFFINPTNKAGSSLYKFTAIVKYPAENEAIIVFENDHKPNSFTTRLKNTLNLSFKDDMWVFNQ